MYKAGIGQQRMVGGQERESHVTKDGWGTAAADGLQSLVLGFGLVRRGWGLCRRLRFWRREPLLHVPVHRFVYSGGKPFEGIILNQRKGLEHNLHEYFDEKFSHRRYRSFNQVYFISASLRVYQTLRNYNRD